jgi:YD repeat-containing protein
MDGNVFWEVYANAPQWQSPWMEGSDGSRLIAEYRFAPGTFTMPAAGASPDSSDWSERTVYVYDDGVTDQTTGYSYDLPSNEQLHLGRVAQVQEWTRTVDDNNNVIETMTAYTDTQYDPITGQPSSITTGDASDQYQAVNYAYDPATGNKVRMWVDSGTIDSEGDKTSSGTTDDTAYAYNSQGELTDVYTLVLDGTVYATYTGIDPSTHNPTFTGIPLTVAYTYDAVGNTKTESQADDTTTTYTYDDENRLTAESVENTSTDEPVFAETYDLNHDGTRADVT